MTLYHGIPIDETNLLFNSVVSVIFTAIFFVIAAVVFLYTIVLATNKKENKRIQKLKKKTPTDEKAKKQIEQLRKKQKKRFACIKSALPFFLLPLGLAILMLFGSAIPTVTDYIKKDYVVYSGNFSVEINVNTSKFRFTTYEIILENETTLNGLGGLKQDDTCGTVVYAKRSKMTLGSKSSSPN